MPQHKGAVRRVRLSEKRRTANKGQKVDLRKLLKGFAESPEGATTDLKTIQSRLDKLARKGLIHKNFAANKKSKLARAAKVEKASHLLRPHFQQRDFQFRSFHIWLFGSWRDLCYDLRIEDYRRASFNMHFAFRSGFELQRNAKKFLQCKLHFIFHVHQHVLFNRSGNCKIDGSICEYH